MTNASQSPHPTPARIFQSLNAYQLTAALKAAIELDFFTAIAAGADTASAVASRCHVPERAARILCDYLVLREFLIKNGDRYALAPDAAAFLDRRSPSYIGSAADFITAPFLQDEFRKFTGAVRKGGTLMGTDGSLAPEHPMWVEFARAMASLQSLSAEMIAKLVRSDSGECKILDVAAGHGMFGVILGGHNPNAEIYALDWPAVLEVARENAQKAGISSRFHAIPGDAFHVDFGSGYDLILLTNFLHHADPSTIEAFMRKVHAALKPGGRAITLEFIPNDDRVSPPEPASFAIILLATTPAGDAYTFAEYERMFRSAGFTKNELHVLPTTHSVIISTK